jgi:hypothetical protein
MFFSSVTGGWTKVAANPIQIFVSYARNDDASPPEDLTKKGFVTALHNQLYYLLGDLGEPKPKIWRDVRRIDRADQFDEEIAHAISDSAMLLIILSRNWMASAACREELNSFRDRWKCEGEMGLRQRIVVVGKRHVPPESRPSLLQHQEGYLFYALDDPDEVGLEREFFVRGEVRDNRYVTRLEELAGLLWRRGARFGAGEGIQIETPERRWQEPRPKNDKAVYLAKPASDMRGAYDRLVTELTSSGYAVVPDPSKDIPTDTRAVQFVDEALSQADIAIHLLGEKSGFAPDGAEPIVKLQLARAASRLAGAAISGEQFRRIIWAPKVLNLNSSEQRLDQVRDPLGVLEKFDRYVSSDTIEGDTLSKLVELVILRLSRATVPRQNLDDELGNARAYVYHRPEDMEYAFDIGKALKERNITPRFPAYEGSDAERVQLHRQYLRECDSVVVCWASAPDVWVKVTSNELVDWRVLGRTKEFARRGLVAGPPPGMPKRMFVELFPKDEMDVVVDLTSCLHPQAADLGPLIGN